MNRKPIIGITPSPTVREMPHGAFDQFSLSDTYTTAVEAAGGVPIILPPQAGNLEELLGILDGVIISGGGDIDPSAYGDTDVHPKTGGIHAGRDALELGLIPLAIERKVPMLCICRGIQALNVACNGTLYQDVADQYGDSLEHRQQTAQISREHPSHRVTAQPGSLLASVYGTTEIQVNSFHHQGINKLGDGLIATGVSDDDLIEGVELPDHPWLLGVQWHPEMMYAAHAEHLKPFEALVVAALAGSAVPA